MGGSGSKAGAEEGVPPDGPDLFAEAVVRDAEDGAFGDVVVVEDRSFDLRAVDVLSAA